MKIFVLSLHRSGTRSVTEFFERYGYNTKHCPKHFDGTDHQEMVRGNEHDLSFIAKALRPVFDAHDVISDVPVPVLYPMLEKDYPDAKFVLTIRPARDWLKSVRRHCEGRPLQPFERAQYWSFFPKRPDALGQVSDKHLLEMYHQHTENVIAAIPRDRLAVLHLYSARVAPELLRFSGHPHDAWLPHLNKS